MPPQNSAPGKSIGSLNAAELRRRWTIELTSLRRRSSPTKQQESRIRELQMFLAALDPLRRLEIEWRAIPEFPARFRNEVAAQQGVNDAAYRRIVLARVLSAFSGQMLPDPGHPCQRSKAAQQVCEDHGEDWNSLLKEMLDAKYLRQSTSGEFSVGGPGYHLAAKAAEAAIAPQAVETRGTLLFDRLGQDVRQTLGLFKIGMQSDLEGNSSRNLPSPPLANAPARAPVLSSKSSLQHVSKKPAPLTKPKATPARPPSRQEATFDAVNRAEKVSNSASAAIRQLIQWKTLPIVEEMRLIESEPAAIWQCDLSVTEVRTAPFSGVGGSQRDARQDASAILLEALKHHFAPNLNTASVSPSKRMSEQSQSIKPSKLRPWPASLLAKCRR